MQTETINAEKTNPIENNEILKLHAGITSAILKLITGNPTAFFTNQWISTQEIVAQFNHSDAYLFRKITVEDVEAILDAAKYHSWFHTHMENGKVAMINPDKENTISYSEWSSR